MKRVFFFFILNLVLCSWQFSWAAELEPRKTFEDAPFVHDAVVTRIVDHQTVLAESKSAHWEIDELVGLQSKSLDGDFIGYLEVKSLKEVDGHYLIQARLLRLSGRALAQTGDKLIPLDFTREIPQFSGNTWLQLRSLRSGYSSRYKPLISQGLTIGPTAQTLFEAEKQISLLGLSYYGLTDSVTIGSFLPSWLVGLPNASIKKRAYFGETHTLSVGATMSQLARQSPIFTNVELFWDSIGNENIISHTLLTLAIVRFGETEEDATAIKSLGTSSIQTGYEFVLPNWNRVLMGPSYNFAKQRLGGYLSYVMIWDLFHLNVGMTTTDIASMRLGKEGYLLTFDAFWRWD